MKMSELRGCDSCGGKIVPIFYVLRFSIAIFKQQATNQVLGMAQYFGGALGLAEMFVGDPEVAFAAMDEPVHKELMTELFICQDCYMKPLHLAELAEKRQKAIDKIADDHAAAADTRLSDALREQGEQEEDAGDG